MTNALKILCRNCQLHVHLDGAGIRVSAHSAFGVIALLILFGVIALAWPK